MATAQLASLKGGDRGDSLAMRLSRGKEKESRGDAAVWAVCENKFPFFVVSFVVHPLPFSVKSLLVLSSVQSSVRFFFRVHCFVCEFIECMLITRDLSGLHPPPAGLGRQPQDIPQVVH